jgi:hypothetical protein
MNNGVLIIANNSDDIDYAKMSLISAELAKKNLNVPVSLITDNETINSKSSVDKDIFYKTFDRVILTEIDETDNRRSINHKGNRRSVPFLNFNRNKVLDHTPYDRTLLIDSDFLIFSDNLSKFWDIDQSVLISSSMVDIHGKKGGNLDAVVSPQSIPLFWATTVMFTKNEESKNFFDLVEHVKQNYKFYSQLYLFDSRQYRNDISFSIAYHILRGFNSKDNLDYFLPPIKTVNDKDEIFSYENNLLKLFLFNELSLNYDKIISIKNTDLHFMNKFELLENMDLF